MVGSSANISCPVFIINAIVAEELSKFADVLENAKDFNSALSGLIKDAIKRHKRIIYSGNSYSEEWKKEAARRGLVDYPTTVDALPHYADEKNVKLFEKHKILSESEIKSRTEILLENYTNTLHIEALTALDMARKEITPSIIAYETFLLKAMKYKKELGAIPSGLETGLINTLSALSEEYGAQLDKLESLIESLEKTEGTLKKARYCKEKIIPAMEALRKTADRAELIIGKRFCTLPDYEDILYSVKY